MSSILVNTCDFYDFAEELAHDYNLNCAESENEFLTAECFFDEVRDINNEQIESVRSYLNWFDCYAITEAVTSGSSISNLLVTSIEIYTNKEAVITC